MVGEEQQHPAATDAASPEMPSVVGVWKYICIKDGKTKTLEVRQAEDAEGGGGAGGDASAVAAEDDAAGAAAAVVNRSLGDVTTDPACVPLALHLGDSRVVQLCPQVDTLASVLSDPLTPAASPGDGSSTFDSPRPAAPRSTNSSFANLKNLGLNSSSGNLNQSIGGISRRSYSAAGMSTAAAAAAALAALAGGTTKGRWVGKETPEADAKAASPPPAPAAKPVAAAPVAGRSARSRSPSLSPPPPAPAAVSYRVVEKNVSGVDILVCIADGAHGSVTQTAVRPEVFDTLVGIWSYTSSQDGALHAYCILPTKGALEWSESGISGPVQRVSDEERAAAAAATAERGGSGARGFPYKVALRPSEGNAEETLWLRPAAATAGRARKSVLDASVLQLGGDGGDGAAAAAAAEGPYCSDDDLAKTERLASGDSQLQGAQLNSIYEQVAAGTGDSCEASEVATRLKGPAEYTEAVVGGSVAGGGGGAADEGPSSPLVAWSRHCHYEVAEDKHIYNRKEQYSPEHAVEHHVQPSPKHLVQEEGKRGDDQGKRVKWKVGVIPLPGHVHEDAVLESDAQRRERLGMSVPKKKRRGRGASPSPLLTRAYSSSKRGSGGGGGGGGGACVRSRSPSVLKRTPSASAGAVARGPVSVSPFTAAASTPTPSALPTQTKTEETNVAGGVAAPDTTELLNATLKTLAGTVKDASVVHGGSDAGSAGSKVRLHGGACVEGIPETDSISVSAASASALHTPHPIPLASAYAPTHHEPHRQPAKKAAYERRVSPSGSSQQPVMRGTLKHLSRSEKEELKKKQVVSEIVRKYGTHYEEAGKAFKRGDIVELEVEGYDRVSGGAGVRWLQAVVKRARVDSCRYDVRLVTGEVVAGVSARELRRVELARKRKATSTPAAHARGTSPTRHSSRTHKAPEVHHTLSSQARTDFIRARVASGSPDPLASRNASTSPHHQQPHESSACAAAVTAATASVVAFGSRLPSSTPTAPSRNASTSPHRPGHEARSASTSPHPPQRVASRSPKRFAPLPPS
eukprot:Rhum_TRINITY_DN14670_c11_g1::Rhum_TRINITY_DN14670_c11_g1_i1::g.108365::m.108365